MSIMKKTRALVHSQIMPFHLSDSKEGSKASHFTSSLVAYLVFIFCLGSIVDAENRVTKIGAIIDVDSRVGKEQKTAMIMAVQNFNNNSTNHRLKAYFRRTSYDPIQIVSTAEELMGTKQVQAIVGTRTWEEAALVADVVKRAQVPVLSLAAPFAPLPSSAQNRWPFMLQMSTDSVEQINCIGAIVNSYHWRKIITIREDNSYFGNSWSLTTLSKSLEHVGASIEYNMIFPPFYSLSDPKGFVKEEVLKLMDKQSRVFIVLQSSLSLATLLFKEAKQRGLMGRDSVWILTNSISDLLDSAHPSFVSSLQGAIGIKSYYAQNENKFLDLKEQFQNNFRWEHPDEENFDPGFHALKAYDSIKAIAEAAEGLGRNDTSNPKSLLDEIQSNNFIGLSGEVRFHGGKLESTSIFKIVNIVGVTYKELGIWLSNFGFSDSFVEEKGNMVIGVNSRDELGGSVNWPGGLDRVPKGWAMPTFETPLKIGVPEDHPPFTFLNHSWDRKSNEDMFDGFCIKLFKEVVKVLDKNYTLHYEFVPFSGSYDELTRNISDKIFGGAVADITILAERSRSVEFTQPFMESALSMLVPVKNEPPMALLFVKPFTLNMWIVTFAILLYTMLVIWFLENQSDNKQFKGPWKDQLATAMWFTFSSLFFAHGEKINSNYTKLVVVVWLFVVLALISSYKASLTSMLTVSRLEPSVTGLDWIRQTNATVGCNDDSFVESYLRGVLNLQNIKPVTGHDLFPDEFTSGNISAAFLDLPHKKVFLNDHCKEYTETGPTYSFGGLGFAFQKGSPMARDVSEAILTLLENGVVEKLITENLGSLDSCSNSRADPETESLSLRSFWGLYLIFFGISSLCFSIFFVLRLLKKKSENREARVYDRAQIDGGVCDVATNFGQVIEGGTPKPLTRRSTFA